MDKVITKVRRVKNAPESLEIWGYRKLNDGKFHEFHTQEEGLTEREIMDMIDESKVNQNFVKTVTKDSLAVAANKNKGTVAGAKLQRKHLAAGATITALALLLGLSLGKQMVKAPGLEQELDLRDNTVEVQKSFTMEKMVEEVNAIKELLAKHGIERNDNKLFSFYFVNNIQYFDAELTEALIEEKILPDSANKILNDYNGIFNDIVNHNLKALYQSKGQVIDLSNFVRDDFDKLFVQALDKETMDIVKASSNEKGQEEYQEAKAIILGIKATATNDTIHETSAGAQYLATYAQGVMTMIHGATKGVDQEDINNFETVVEAAREDIYSYMIEVCPSLQSAGKTK